jgi:NAD(P)-dependent dehydrogenase (short-subunit alcohol dehydrogenase family)
MPKVIIMTGVTRGLGRSLVHEFVQKGHTVIGCGRSATHIQQLSFEWGEPHFFESVDVRDDPQVALWARHTLENYGPPDLLINNAGLMNRSAKLWELNAFEFDPIIDVNIKGVANVLRHFLPAMIARKKGVIINFSSGWGRSVSAEVAPYCASKYAVEGLTLALAEELPEGMAAIPLNPGVINTDMLRSCWSDGASSYPLAEEWAQSAASYILRLSSKDNGKSLSIPT